MKKILLSLLVVVSSLYALFGKQALYFFERTSPSVSIISAPKGIGAGNYTLEFTAEDAGAGLDEVIVRMGNKEIIKKKYEEGIKKDKLKVNIDGKSLGLKDGEKIEFSIRVFDKSFFSNGFEVNPKFNVDLIKPRVEVLSVQHNGFVGGALMVFYKHLSDDIIQSGVKIDGNLYRGFPASQLDQAFEAQKNVYFCLFPIPGSFDDNASKIKVAVLDAVGNEGEVEFYQHIRSRINRAENMKMPKEFFIKKVNELLPKYLSAIGSGGMTADASDMTNEQLAEGFRKVNEDYRGLLEKELKKISESSAPSRLWNGVFEKPLPAKPTATFSEKRTYSIDGVAAGGSLHVGVDLAQSANSEVGASNSGKVVFADDLGIYGNAIVIDHGFGLITLYGHLSSINVQVGDVVERSAKIGRTGATGLAGGDHLHFEFRLQGVPVTPFEWLDPLWIRSHIDGQINDTKQGLGIVTAAVVPE